jgi:hypothetical protein
MKTYTKTIQETKPRLKITHDDFTSSPREWSNLGYFITIDQNYRSPDNVEYLQDIIKETGKEATSTEDHMDMIKKTYRSLGYEGNIVAIYPICKYEHSSVSYSLGQKHGFDYSNNGFYIITDKTQKELGTPKKDFETIIKQELEVYNKYANGEVYGFVLYDEAGEVEDSCSGFYDIDDIKDHLPEEWKDETLSDYITY